METETLGTGQECQLDSLLKARQIKCPKNYGSYDMMTKNCPDCKEGKQYQSCRHSGENCKGHACGGWMSGFYDDHPIAPGPHCCTCYIEKHKRKEGSN